MPDNARLFAYSLAKEMGVWDVEAWLGRISWRQLRLWQVYAQMMENEQKRASKARKVSR